MKHAALLVVLAVVGLVLTGCMQALPTDPALREASGTFGVRPTPTSAGSVPPDAAAVPAPPAPPTETSVFESALPPPAEAVPPPAEAVPPPAEAVPPPAEAVPPPAEAAPPPAEAAPPPAEAAPPPAANDSASVFAPPPTPTVAIIIELAPPAQLSNEERWRRQQVDRQTFESVQNYYANGADLWWYDPINQQHLIVGTFDGPLVAQARFVLREQGVPALEVPYQINQSYGLTAISPAIIERMAAAGYTEWVETYVLETPDVFGR